MVENEVLSTLLSRKSVRNYKNTAIDKSTIDLIVRAGQQAPFASQLYSIIFSSKGPFAFKAPVWFLICLDANKLELIMKKRGWPLITNDITMLLLGIQDAAYMAENMVIAAESIGLGSCFLGEGSISAKRIRYLSEKHKLPKKVLPIVELVLGYPDEEFPIRPRYPLNYTLFEDEYPILENEIIENAMETMDIGYMEQEYYRKYNAKIKIEDEKREDMYSFDNYCWTEHISRKWGQWVKSPKDLQEVLIERGFNISD